MAADRKHSQKTLEQRGLATIAMTYPEEMGIIAVASDLSERTCEQVSPDQIASLRKRLEKGKSYREALLQVERADIRFKLKALAKDMRDLFDEGSGESDRMRARAYAGHTLAGVYKQLYDHLDDEIERVRAEDTGEEGEEQNADFTLVPDEEPQTAPAVVVAQLPGPVPAEKTAAPEDDETQKMKLLERLL